MKNFFILIFILLLIGCSSREKNDFINEAESTDLSSLNIENIYLNSNVTEIYKSLGEPDYIEEIEDPLGIYYIYGSDEKKSDLEIQISEEKIIRFMLSTNEYEFYDDLIINLSKEKIISKVGSNYYLREDTGSEIIGYYDKDNYYSLELYLDEEERITHLTFEIYKE